MKTKSFFLAIILSISQTIFADEFEGEDGLRYDIYDMVENKCCVVGGSYSKYLSIPSKVRIKNRVFEVTYIKKEGHPQMSVAGG